MAHRRLISGFGIAAIALASGACVAKPPHALRCDEAALYLPYPAGATATCIQEGPGPLSHDGIEAYAVDFLLPVGHPVVAARAGEVIAVKEDSNCGGPTRRHIGAANYVRIRHPDWAVSVYLHLKYRGVSVTRGQRVERGQLIGYSGNTGWSSVPHLHFHVESIDPDTGSWRSVPLAFADIRGAGKPKLFCCYQSANHKEPVR